MEWFILPLIILVAALGAIATFIDNFVSDVYFRGRRPEAQKIFGLFGYSVMLIFCLIVAPLATLDSSTITFLLLSGVIHALGSIFYYRSFKSEEATGITILAQLSPILALISSFFILGDQIAIPQLAAFALLIVAALLIIFSRGKGRLKTQLRATLLTIAAITFWVSANTLFTLSSDQSSFTTNLFYFILGKLATDLTLTLIFKSWRTRVKNVFREFRGKLLRTSLIREIIHPVSEIVWRFILLSAPFAIAYAVESTSKLIITFILGLTLSIVWPRFGRERLAKRTILHHLIALSLAVIAILIIQFA